jgi:plasmid stability protein
MANLQVKGIDEALYRALRARAALENRSLSQQVVTIVEQHLSRAAGLTTPVEAFLELAGSWRDDRSAARIARDLRRARRGKSRARRLRDVLA